MATRHDVSEVSPQGGYIAKRCPVRAQLDVLQPGIPIEPDEVSLLRMQEGVEFEADVFRELQGVAPDGVWVFVPEDLRREAAVSMTVAAMGDGVGVIAG